MKDLTLLIVMIDVFLLGRALLAGVPREDGKYCWQRLGLLDKRSRPGTAVGAGIVLVGLGIVGGLVGPFLTALIVAGLLLIWREDLRSRTNGDRRPAAYLRDVPASQHSDEEIEAADDELPKELRELSTGDTDEFREELIEFGSRLVIRTRFRLLGWLGLDEPTGFDDLVVRVEHHVRVNAVVVLLEDWDHTVDLLGGTASS